MDVTLVRTGRNLRDQACLGCGHIGLAAEAEHQAGCPACGRHTPSAGPLCPRCGHVGAHEARVCGMCGLGLYRHCANCDTLNWAGDRICFRCQKPVDTLQHVLERHEDPHTQAAYARDNRLYAQQLDRWGAQRALAEVQAREDERLAGIAAAAARSDVEQRRLLQVGVALSALFLLSVVVCVLILLIG